MTLWLRGAMLARPTGERPITELWGAENSFHRMRRHSAAQRGALSPTMSSGERGTHSSEWEGTPPLRRERHAHRWPSGWGEQCWLYQQRALGSGTLIPRNEWTFRRSEGSGILIGNPLMRGVMLALPITSSGERRTHSSEWEGTQTLSRERHAHR